MAVLADKLPLSKRRKPPSAVASIASSTSFTRKLLDAVSVNMVHGRDDPVPLRLSEIDNLRNRLYPAPLAVVNPGVDAMVIAFLSLPYRSFCASFISSRFLVATLLSIASSSFVKGELWAKCFRRQTEKNEFLLFDASLFDRRLKSRRHLRHDHVDDCTTSSGSSPAQSRQIFFQAV